MRSNREDEDRQAGNSVVHRLREPFGGFVSEKETYPVVDFARTVSPWERIADSIERLAEALKPKQEALVTHVPLTLSPHQVAQRIGVNVQTVMRWCRQRKMGRKKSGGHRWEISEGEVARYEKRQAMISRAEKGRR